jgi:hypothetical protein
MWNSEVKKMGVGIEKYFFALKFLKFGDNKNFKASALWIILVITLLEKISDKELESRICKDFLPLKNKIRKPKINGQ